MPLTRSTRTYFGLVLTLALLAAANVFLPQGKLIGQFELPASKPVVAVAAFFMVIVIYGGLGFAGLVLSRKVGFTDLWDSDVTNRQRFLIPAMIGIGIGIFFIAADAVFQQFHSLGKIPHPPFPTSVVASISAGIGEELIFRLFLISLWVWLLSLVIPGERWRNRIFWIVASLSGLAFALGHLPSVMAIFGWNSIAEIPTPIIAEVILLNGLLSLLAASYFRRYGFLSAVGIHFWTDVVWHVIYGLV